MMMGNTSVTKCQMIEEISDVFNRLSSYPDADNFIFDIQFLSLLKDTNKNNQEYYVLENNQDITFFVLYKMKLNIFTFGKLSLNLPVKVIGLPCSVSQKGYITHNQRQLFEFIRTIPGAKLVLNCDEREPREGFAVGKTLPTCVLNMKWDCIDDYLKGLRSNYRYRINKAVKDCKSIKIRKIDGSSFNESIYQLYLNTYHKSKYKLELLDINFFKRFNGEIFVFENEDLGVAFYLLQRRGRRLFFIFCGMDYSSNRTPNLYYYMLFNIIQYGIENKVESIDFGQTSEQTKLRFGCVLKPKYFYAHHSNKLIHSLLSKNVRLLEYREVFKHYNVFQKETK